MKFKRTATLLLATSLVITSLAGCSKSGDDTAGKETTSKTTESTDAGEKSEKPVVLRAITHTGQAPAADSKVYQVLKEKLNVEFEIIETTTDNRKEKVNIMLATGDIPDLFFSSVAPTSDEMQKWMKQGLILSYDQYADSYPNVKAQLEKFKDITNLTNGQYYMLPIQRQIGSYAFVNDHSFWVRKDYLENLGMEIPQTFEEFTELLYAMTNNDPDGNGVNDTFGLTIDNAWWLYPIYNMFGASEKYYVEENGEWKAEAISQNMKDAVVYLNKLYKDGVLDPEFMINKSGRVYENFISGKSGLMFKNAGVNYNGIYDQIQDAFPDKDPKDLFTWVPVPTGVNGKAARLDGGANYWGATFLGNTQDETKTKKALEVLDFLASEEGQDLFFYGIEGEHYKVEDGKKVSLIPDLKTVYEYDNTGRLGHLAVWLDGLFPESVANREECKESYQASMDAVHGDPLLYVDLDIDATTKKTLKEYTRQTLAEVISGSGDVEKAWEKYVEGWYKAGGTAYTEAVNKAAK